MGWGGNLISLTLFSFDLMVALDEKSGDHQSGFILLGPWMFVQNVMAICPVVVGDI